MEGYEKTVTRLKNGYLQRSQLQHQLTSVPRGENYDKYRSMDFCPPEFLAREKIQKAKPYFWIDANIGPGKTGRIVLHEGDDPQQVTENFARAFQISEDMKIELFNMLQK